MDIRYLSSRLHENAGTDDGNSIGKERTNNINTQEKSHTLRRTAE